MELLAKLSFQERACQGDTGCGKQRIPGCSGKGMVPIGAKLWFKAHYFWRRSFQVVPMSLVFWPAPSQGRFCCGHSIGK